MASLSQFTVVENTLIAQGTYRLALAGDCSDLTVPGQFVNLTVPGFYLRRPFSVYTADGSLLTLIYKVLGQGTDALTGVRAGETLEVMSGLGNGFTAPDGVEKPLIIGGGVGVVPLYSLASMLVDKGMRPQVVFGFATAAEVALVQEIRALGVPVAVTTVDGSAGVTGLVTDAITELRAAGENWDYLYACGPTPMLRALDRLDLPGQFSLEERMGCGFGGCMGCVTDTENGLQRVCKEGPVFDKDQLMWKESAQ